jgi:sugar lactone lactonase YvrE
MANFPLRSAGRRKWVAVAGIVLAGMLAAACGSGDADDDAAVGAAPPEANGSTYASAADRGASNVVDADGSEVAADETVPPRADDPAAGDADTADAASAVGEAAEQVVPIPALSGPVFREVAVWGRDDGNSFTAPNGVAIDAGGNVYVTEGAGDRIQKFTPNGDLITSWGGTGGEPGQLTVPIDVDFDADGLLYISEAGNSRVQKFTPDGDLVGSFGSHGQGPGQFFSALALGISTDQRVYVIDWGGYRVNVFTTDGEFLFSFGEQGGGDGQFELAQGLGVAPNGDVYVADTENIRVQRFTSEGEHVATFGTNGFDPGQFRRPARIFINEFLYISDLVADTVAQFHLDGTFIANVEVRGLRRAHGVAIGDDGRMYIADTGNGVVRVLELIGDGSSEPDAG